MTSINSHTELHADRSNHAVCDNRSRTDWRADVEFTYVFPFYVTKEV